MKRPPLARLSLRSSSCGSLLAALLASSFTSCGGGSVAPRPAAAAKAKPGLVSPARWAVTPDGGAIHVAGSGPDARGALLWGGRRYRTKSGFLSEHVAKEVDELRGGRFVEGAGVFLWSSQRLYRAATFLGEAEAVGEAEVVDVARWLDGVVVSRRDGAVLTWKPGGKLRPLREALGPPDKVALVAAHATPDGRAAVLDALGHAYATPDAGKTWIDVFAVEGLRFERLGVSADGALELSGRSQLVLERGASALGPPGRGHRGPAVDPHVEVVEGLEEAVRGGVVFRGDEPTGDRVLFAREHQVLAMSAHTLSELGSAAWSGLATDFSERCRVVLLGGLPYAACAHTAGAQVMKLGPTLGQVDLDATFGAPAEGRGPFLSSGPVLANVLAYEGRCGSEDPGLLDFDPSVRHAQKPEQEYYGPAAPPPPEELPVEPQPGDERPLCVRTPTGHWQQHLVAGKDAARLHRFVLGEEGGAVALVWDAEEGEEPDPPRRPGPHKPGRPEPEGDGEEPEGRAPPVAPRVLALVPRPSASASASGASDPPREHAGRVVRVVQLRRAAWTKLGLQPARLSDSGTDGASLVDREAWVEPSGAVRVWGVAAMGEGKPNQGLRLRLDGTIEELPLPKDTQRVWFGGRFALAQAEAPGDDAKQFYESTDGGETWTAVGAPPARTVPEQSPWPTCSEVGCVVGDGLLRIGWGGAEPKAPKLETATPPPLQSKEVRPRVTCSVDGVLPPVKPRPPRAPAPVPAPPKPGPAKDGKDVPAVPKGKVSKKEPKPEKPVVDPAALDVPIALGVRGLEAGTSDGKRWRVRVLTPFSPAAQPKELTVSPPPEAFRFHLVPVLEAAGAPTLLGMSGKQVIGFTERAATLFDAESEQHPQGAVRARDTVFTIDGGGAIGGAAGRSFATLFRLPRAGSGAPPLHLGLDPSGAPLVVGFLGQEGFLAPLEAARLGAGVPRAIPGAATLVLATDPRCRVGVRGRFVGPLPFDSVTIKEAPGGASHTLSGGVPAVVAVAADVLCLEALDALTWDGVELQASFVAGGPKAPSPSAVARRGGATLSAKCTLGAER